MCWRWWQFPAPGLRRHGVAKHCFCTAALRCRWTTATVMLQCVHNISMGCRSGVGFCSAAPMPTVARPGQSKLLGVLSCLLLPQEARRNELLSQEFRQHDWPARAASNRCFEAVQDMCCAGAGPSNPSHRPAIAPAGCAGMCAEAACRRVSRPVSHMGRPCDKASPHPCLPAMR